MGCIKSKEVIIDSTGENIIKLFNNCDKDEHKLNLDRAIKLYEFEKNKVIGCDIDYKTKCIIVMCFIRDIDQIISNDINNYLYNFKIPIFIIQQLEQYRKNITTDSILLMKSFDMTDMYNYSVNKSFDQKINIIINIINNIENI
jgi:hypothetical protein